MDPALIAAVWTLAGSIGQQRRRVSRICRLSRTGTGADSSDPTRAVTSSAHRGFPRRSAH